MAVEERDRIDRGEAIRRYGDIPSRAAAIGFYWRPGRLGAEEERM
jgi:hypothetical protein